LINRGLNRAVLSGTVLEVLYSRTSKGYDVCTFTLETIRPGREGREVTAHVKVNVYAPVLVDACKYRADFVNSYVLVDGELMNRDFSRGDMALAVRALDVLFLGDSCSTGGIDDG
jgi:hypothetical protein